MTEPEQVDVNIVNQVVTPGNRAEQMRRKRIESQKLTSQTEKNAANIIKAIEVENVEKAVKIAVNAAREAANAKTALNAVEKAKQEQNKAQKIVIRMSNRVNSEQKKRARLALTRISNSIKNAQATANAKVAEEVAKAVENAANANTASSAVEKVQTMLNQMPEYSSMEQRGRVSKALKRIKNAKATANAKVAEKKATVNRAAAEQAAKNEQKKANEEQAAKNKKANEEKAVTEKAAANKAKFIENIRNIKGGNINKLRNINESKLTDEDLKGALQALSVKGTTGEHKEMMKKLLKIWVEKGKTVNSAQISKNSPFIKSLNSDIKRITNIYALRQKFTSTSSTLGITSNTPNTIKKALLTQNGREGIIKSYGLGIPAISPIPEIVSALHKRGSFKNSITLNSLKKEYQNLREAFPNNKNINAAITSISLVTNANMRAKINQLKQNIPDELRSGNAKIGLVLKSNGSPYKLVNYTKINQAIKNFKATGKPQNLNNNDIITNAANGTWSLVEVPKNLIK